MNLMHFIIGGKTTPKHSMRPHETDEVSAQYAKLVKSAEAHEKTWAEIATQIEKMKPIAPGVSSTGLIRSIRDER